MEGVTGEEADEPGGLADGVVGIRKGGLSLNSDLGGGDPGSHHPFSRTTADHHCQSASLSMAVYGTQNLS